MESPTHDETAPDTADKRASHVSQPSPTQSNTLSAAQSVNNDVKKTNPDDSPPQPSSAAPTGPAMCGVCEASPSKYKCPRCYLPYCSVICNKTHRDTHPPDPEPSDNPPKSPGKTELTSSEPTSANPFHVLETSDKLQVLFHKYPRLPAQLLEIHAATLPPQPSREEKAIPASLMKGVVKKDAWNTDMGIKNGKEALRKARRANGESGRAIREYSELVLHFINEADAKGDAAAALRQQAAQEDSMAIQSLMAQEKERQ